MGRLHFFPGPHVLVWEEDGKAAEKVEAWGGVEPTLGVNYGTMKPQRTTPGRYIIHSCAPYVTRTWEYSKIAWGTPLRVSTVNGNQRIVLVQNGMAGQGWKPLTDIIPSMTMEKLSYEFQRIYGDKNKYDSNEDGIPDYWVLNDFGPLAIRYFVDKNHNRKLDSGEHLMGEMFHTTTINEAQVERGEEVTLFPSHGCIHISPLSRDRLRTLKAFQPGTELIIHPYSDALPAVFK